MNATSLKLSAKTVAGALVLLAIAGCTPTEKRLALRQSALQTVLQRGTLRVGDCLSFAPFGFMTKTATRMVTTLTAKRCQRDGREAGNGQHHQRQPHP